MAASEQPADESFETLLGRLEEIVGNLEAGERPLDESLALYESGVAALKRCHVILDKAEKRIRMLVRDAEGNPELRPIELPESIKNSNVTNKRGSGRGAAKEPQAVKTTDSNEELRSEAVPARPQTAPDVQKKNDKSGEQSIDSEAINAQNPTPSTKTKAKPSPGGNETGGLFFGGSK